MPSQVPAMDRRRLRLRRRERGVGRVEREPLDHGADLGADPGVVVPVPQARARLLSGGGAGT